MLGPGGLSTNTGYHHSKSVLHNSRSADLSALTERRSQTSSLSRRSTNRSGRNNFAGDGAAGGDTILTVREAALEINRLNYLTLFRYARPIDYILMFLGLVFALLSAVLIPVLVYMYGNFFVLATVIHTNKCGNYSASGVPPRGVSDRLQPMRRHYILLLSVAYAIILFLAHGLFMLTASNQLHRVRNLYMESILRKDFIWFDTYIDRNLTLRMTGDITRMRSAMGECIPNTITAITASILLIILSFFAHLRVASVSFGTVPLVAFISFMKTQSEQGLIRREQDAYGASNTLAVQVLANIRPVKVFEGEKKELARYKASLFSPFSLWKSVLFGAISCSLLVVVPMATRSLIFYLGATFFFPKEQKRCSDEWSLWNIYEQPVFARLMLSVSCTGVSSLLMASVPAYISRVKKSLSVAAEVFFTIDWKPKINCMSEDGEIPRKKAIGKLQMASVVFEYPRKPLFNVIKNVTISIFPGQLVTLFGPHRSGKSTVLKLLMRLYDPKQGRVRLDGMNMSNLNVGWVRSQFGNIPQEISLFNTTVEENIRFGKLSASSIEIEDVCKRVRIHDDILALPDGYNTVVGSETSTLLPNDMIKRISLARVLLQKPSIILLDDFITNLDDDFEALVLDLVEQMRDKCTIIMTTSRFNSIVKTCDTIFAMKSGRVVETGSHESMMKRRGYYFKMLEETLEDTSILKPYFNSHIRNYKFAQAILRKHTFHDECDKVNYQAILNHPQLLETVLLRHLVNKNLPLVSPRFIGCYHLMSDFSFETDIHYYKWLVRHNLLRSRDLRQQLLPLVRGLEPTSFVPENIGLGLGTIASAGSSLGGESIEELRGTKAKLKNRRKSTKQKFQQFAQASMRKLTGMTIHSGLEANNICESLSSFSGNSGLGPMSTSYSGDTSIVSVVDNKLQHYFGWTVNTSVDTDSIASEDSYDFWDSYNLNLIIAMKKKAILTTNIGAFFRLAKYCWPFLIVICITSSCYGAVLGYTAFASTVMIHAFLENGQGEVIKSSVRYVIVGFVAMGISFGQEVILGFGTYFVNNKMRVDLFKFFLKQPMQWFNFPEHDIDFLLNSLATDPASTHIALFTICTTLCQVTAMLGAVVYAMYSTDAFYPEVNWMILVIAIYLICHCLEGRLRERFNYMLSTALEPADKVTFDAITNVRTVQLLRLEEVFLAKFRDATRLCYRRRILWLTIMRSLSHGISSTSYYAVFGIWLFFAQDKLEYLTTIEDVQGIFHFLLVAEVVIICCFPAAYAIASIPSCADIKFNSAIYAEVFRTYTKHHKLNLKKKVIVVKPEDPPPKLAVKDLAFGRASSEGLDGMTAEFLPGQYVAVVGNKKGSRALIRILLNLYVPSEGQVLLDNIDYTEIQDTCLRRILGFIPQDPAFIEEYTIAQNIAYGDNSRTVSLDEIKKAAQLAYIDAFIDRLDTKYDTKLKDIPETPDTFVFRQRLAVARAAIDNPKILLVDQATTSLDLDSTKLLMDALMKMRVGRTMIVSSQRVEPIRDADIIYVLEGGAVTEVGTHEKLMASRGSYYEMYMSQRLFEMNETHAHEHVTDRRKSRSASVAIKAPTPSGLRLKK